MKAILRNYHQAPRKVRLVADAIRGKSVAEALHALTFMPKYAAHGMKKLLESAVANARHSGIDSSELFIKKVAVDKGLVGKRGRPFARGRSGIIRKTMSHISLELGSRPIGAGAPAKAAKSAQGGSASGRKPRAAKAAK